MPRFPAFIGATGLAQSTIADAEATMNWYVERAQQPQATSPQSLFPSPGFNPLTTVSDVVGRGACNANGRIFAAIGNSLYELLTSTTWKNWGMLAIDANPAQLFYNGVVGGQVGIASGGNWYIFTLSTNILTQVLTNETTQAAYAGGFFFSFNAATGKVKESALNDGTTWSSGIFFQRSLFPDPWKALFVDQYNLLWLIGTETFEVWNNTGVGTQPWAPLSGLSGKYGIAAPFAFAESGLGNFWLSANREGLGQLVYTSGATPTAVDSYAFATAVGGYMRTSTVTDSEMFCYQQDGHTFVIVTFPSVPATWCYDVVNNSFTNRGKWNPNLGRFDAWEPRVYIPAFGQHLALSRVTGQIAAMETAYTTEFDGVTGVVRERTAALLTNEHKRTPIDRVELLMDVGLTTAQVGQGSDPVITMRVSIDGHTWGNARMAGIGRVGQYRKRVYWSQLGADPGFLCRVRSTDPAPSRIVDAYINNLET